MRRVGDFSLFLFPEWNYLLRKGTNVHLGDDRKLSASVLILAFKGQIDYCDSHLHFEQPTHGSALPLSLKSPKLFCSSTNQPNDESAVTEGWGQVLYYHCCIIVIIIFSIYPPTWRILVCTRADSLFFIIGPFAL